MQGLITDVQAPPADLRASSGEALEPRLYLDPVVAEVEQERIFKRTWQLIGHGWTYRFDGTLIGVPEALQFGERLDKATLWINQRVNNLVLREDVDLVLGVQLGVQTRGYRCGPLSEREIAVGWFADRIRADLIPIHPEGGPE